MSSSSPDTPDLLKTNTVILNTDKVDLQKAPAVYALFSEEKCLFVALTGNLNEAIRKHSLETEPVETVRRLMQSKRTKILMYELLKYETSVNCKLKKEHWINLFEPEQVG